VSKRILSCTFTEPETLRVTSKGLAVAILFCFIISHNIWINATSMLIRPKPAFTAQKKRDKRSFGCVYFRFGRRGQLAVKDTSPRQAIARSGATAHKIKVFCNPSKFMIFLAFPNRPLGDLTLAQPAFTWQFRPYRASRSIGEGFSLPAVPTPPQNPVGDGVLGWGNAQISGAANDR
jgi:hypothetical protein